MTTLPPEVEAAAERITGVDFESTPAIVAILHSLYLSAQVAAKEEDARAVCEKCGERAAEFYEAEREVRGEKLLWRGAWFHRYRSDRHVTSKCYASPIYDRLASLRAELEGMGK